MSPLSASAFGPHTPEGTSFPPLRGQVSWLSATYSRRLPTRHCRAVAFVPLSFRIQWRGPRRHFTGFPQPRSGRRCLYKDALRVNLTRPKHGPRKRAPRVVARCSRRACPEGPRGEGTLRILRHGVSMELLRGSGTLANGRRTGRARKQHLEASWALTLGCLRLHLVGVRMFISPVQTSTDRKVPARGLQAAPAKQTRLWRS